MILKMEPSFEPPVWPGDAEGYDLTASLEPERSPYFTAILGKEPSMVLELPRSMAGTSRVASSDRLLEGLYAEQSRLVRRLE